MNVHLPKSRIEDVPVGALVRDILGREFQKVAEVQTKHGSTLHAMQLVPPNADGDLRFFTGGYRVELSEGYASPSSMIEPQKGGRPV